MHLWFTYGPSVDDPELIRQALRTGANGCRLTFSYGTAELQRERAVLVKKIARELGQTCETIADLAGGKVRLADFSPPHVEILAGEVLTLGALGTASAPEQRQFAVTRNSFFQFARPGDVLIIGDGALVLKVRKSSGDTLEAVAVNDGILNPNRGVVLQNPLYSPECLTEKDEEHLRFVAESNLEDRVFDFVALSFVAQEKNITSARDHLQACGNQIPIIAKIESPPGLRNLDSIAGAADYVLAARGDLALLADWIKLPEAMDCIQRAAQVAGTPWILATQIAEGLERFDMPTRAEICDLHAWVRAGIAGVLLSYETAFGRAPIKAIAAVASMLEQWAGQAAAVGMTAIDSRTRIQT